MQGNTVCVVDDDMAVLRSLKELLASDALRLGAVAFLVKPFDDEAFLEAVHSAF
jgi:FixJ family two-component response regulator